MDGRQFKVNVVSCAGARDARRVEQALLKAHGGMRAFVLRRGSEVIEFSGADHRVARRAPYVLGLRPQRVVYRVTFDAAPLKSADYMSWNDLFEAFLALAAHPEDAAARARIEELRPAFGFADVLTLRKHGLGKARSDYSFEPQPVKRTGSRRSDLLTFTFGDLPPRAGVPRVRVTATVECEAFADSPTRRQPGAALVAPTRRWPSDDPEIGRLAGEITAGCRGDEQKVQALLDWLMPGRNIRFGGPVTGSRYGVLKVLEQGFGHCWDFSDLFVTLCRASGVPARQVAGWLYGQCGHVWAEVHLTGHGWRQVDPTDGMACGNEHIPYLTSEDGEMTLVYLSRPAIEVLREE